MTRSVMFRLLVSCALLAAVLTGCSRDPNVRKQKYFDSGQQYFAQGKYREAAIQYSNAIQIDSRFADARYQLSQTYLKLGETQRAFQELNRTVEIAPDNIPAQTDLANLFCAARNPDGSAMPEMLKQAKTHLDILRAKVPNTPETHEAWANYYAAQNDLISAAQEVKQAIRLNPNRSESYLQLALIEVRSKLPDQAEASFKKAVEVDPKAMNARLALGGFYQGRNRLSDAEQQFRSAMSIDPKNPTPRAAIVRVMMQEGRKDDAEAFLRQTKRELSDVPEGYSMLGDFYFATADLDKAFAEYSSLYSDHPKDSKVKRNYIQILILKNQLDEASKLNNEILKSSPRDVESLIFKGQIQLAQNNAPGAVESLQTALTNDQDNAIARYQLGRAFAQQHDYSRAEQEWRRAVSLRPDLTDAQREIAMLELSRGQVDAVMQTAQQIITAEPYSPDGFLLKGVVDLSRRQYAEAQQDAQEALKRDPKGPKPYVQLGTIQLSQKHFADAEKYYQQALEKDPSSSDGLAGLMNTYFAENQLDKAIAAANAQIAKVPNNSSFYDHLGSALLKKKDYPAAEAALRKAVDLDKNNVDAIVKLGKVQADEGKKEQALAVYQRGLKDNQGEATLYILTGELYESKQDWNQAKALYQQALGVSPENPVASNNLAYLMLEQGGNVDVALTMAQAARRGAPDNPSFADTLGWAYYQKGIYQSAISQFQEALRLNEKVGAPDAGDFHYHLGLAYQKANQLSQARQQLERAVKLSPDNSNARKALSELHS